VKAHNVTQYCFSQNEQELRDVEKLIEEKKLTASRAIQMNPDANVTCQICLRTKFADGVGQKCQYCQLKTCARCGSCLKVKSKVGCFSLQITRVLGGVFGGGTSCLYLHAIRSRPKVGVYIPVTLKFCPPPPVPPHAHVCCRCFDGP